MTPEEVARWLDAQACTYRTHYHRRNLDRLKAGAKNIRKQQARIVELEGELYETEQARQIACDSHAKLIKECELLRRRIVFLDEMILNHAAQEDQT